VGTEANVMEASVKWIRDWSRPPLWFGSSSLLEACLLYHHLTPLTTIFFHGSLFFLALQLIGAFDFCPYDL